MPKTKISEFSATPGNNTDIDGINIAEGCAPSGINDAIRELMAQLKDFQAGTAGDSFNGPVGTTTAAAGAFTTLSASGAVTLSGGTANGVPYLNGSKVLTTGSALTFDGTTLTSTTSAATAGNFKATSTTAQVFNVTASNDVNATIGLGVFGSAASSFGMIAAGQPLLGTAASELNIYSSNASGVIKFGLGSTPSEQMRLTSTGLGIGTSSPGARLDVNTGGASNTMARFTSNGSYYSYILSSGVTSVFSADTSGNNSFTVRGASNQLEFYTNGSERMRIDSAGNVGIGAIVPGARLQVDAAQSASVANLLTLRDSSAGTTFNLQTFSDPSFGTSNRFNYDGGYLAFRRSGTEQMRLDYSGNVGIGTSSPGTRLDVSGNLRFSAANPVIEFNNGGAQVYSTTANTLQFATGGGIGSPTERARIDSSGNLLVGTTSGSNRITAVNSGSLAAAIRCENSRNVSGDFALTTQLGSNCNNTSSYHIISATGGADRFYVFGNGNVQNQNNSYGAISDAKLKENVTDATPKLEKLNQVRVVNYNLIGETQKQIGVIAQELEQIFPGMVEETPDRDAEGNALGTTTKSVKYSVFVPMLIKAIQEQQAIIEQLKADVAALKGN